MTSNADTPVELDLTQGVSLTTLGDGEMLAGHVGDETVLLVRRGDEYFAVGAQCTHYHAPLADGLVVGDEIRCPWHHACFNLRTGEATRAPALSPLPCWPVEQRDGKVFVNERQEAPFVARRSPTTSQQPERIVIVGGGAAGFAAAEMLRRQGFERDLVMLSSEQTAPVDRPNLSKDYLAGTASEDWLPLRPESYYVENEIELRLGTEVARIVPERREVVLTGGAPISYDKLLLATGAEPVRLSIPGATQPHVRSLRSVDDSRAIIAQAIQARHAVVLGASFMGLEVAAALRTRNVDVHVVAPERCPMERVFGAELGAFVRSLHEQHGVVFHLGETATAIEPSHVHLKGGGKLPADLVVVAVGVRPRTSLAEQAGLASDSGVLVDSFLETSAPGIFAAGDIARWPVPCSEERIRVEHWAVSERQGQTAALNMLGHHERFAAVPFFWSQHYDVPINYVGHAERWDAIEIDGKIACRDCLLCYMLNGRVRAVASIFRDLDSLHAEVAMEHALEEHAFAEPMAPS